MDAGQGAQQGLENDLRAAAGDGHANLLADRLFAAGEDESVGERLQTRPLPVGEGPGLAPMVYVRPASARAGDRIGRPLGVEALVYLAYLGALDFQPQVGRQVGRERILPRPYVHQALDDGGRLPRGLVVGGVGRDGRRLDGLPASHGSVGPGARDLELEGQVGPDPDNDYPMPGLRHPILLELIQVGVDPVSRGGHGVENRLDGRPVVGALQPADVLRHKAPGAEPLQNPHPIRVEGPIGAVEAPLLADDAEVVARKPESEAVDAAQGREFLHIQLAHVFAYHGLRGVGTQVADVGVARVAVVVGGPLMDKTQRRALDPRPHGAGGHAARPAEKLTEPQNIVFSLHQSE